MHNHTLGCAKQLYFKVHICLYYSHTVDWNALLCASFRGMVSPTLEVGLAKTCLPENLLQELFDKRFKNV